MATMSFGSSFRPPHKAGTQRLQYDDLFEQLIDSDPDAFPQLGPGESLADPSRLGGWADSSNAGELTGVYAGPEASTTAGSSGSPQLGGGDSLVESHNFDTAVPQPMDPARCVSFDGSSGDITASNLLPLLQSTPITPPLTDNTSSMSGSAKSDRVLSGGIRKTYRKGSNSPRMTHPSFSKRSQDHWAHRLEASAENLNYQAYNDPWSPPPSDRLSQWDDSMAYGAAGQGFVPGNQARSANYHPNQFVLPSSSKARSIPVNQRTPVPPYVHRSSSFDPVITSPQAERSFQWSGGSVSPFRYHAEVPSPSHQQLEESKMQPWWPTSSAPSYSTHGRPIFTQDQQRHNTHEHSFANIPSQESYSAGSAQTMAGLGINMSFDNPSYPAYSSSFGDGSYQAGNSRPQEGPRARANPTRADRQRSSSAESSSPSSPSNRSRSTITSRRPSRAQSSHRRSKSQSAPSSASKSAPQGGFVNFTPSDSKRILTGVAPSGSSKTKARREKEAAERRRRLSQAAARAVIEAGGDVGALEREGLLGFG